MSNNNNNNDDTNNNNSNNNSSFMTIFTYNCYECGKNDDDDPAKDPKTGQPVCRHCGSDFIEVIKNENAKEATEWFKAVSSNNNKNDEENENTNQSTNNDNNNNNHQNPSSASTMPPEDIAQRIMQATLGGTSGLPTTTQLVRQPDGTMAHQVVVDARSLNLGRYLNNNNGEGNNNNNDEPFDPNRPPRQAIEIQHQMNGMDLMRMMMGGLNNNNNNNNDQTSNLLRTLLQSSGVQAQVVEVGIDGDGNHEDEEEGEEEEDEEDDDASSWETASGDEQEDNQQQRQQQSSSNNNNIASMIRTGDPTTDQLLSQLGNLGVGLGNPVDLGDGTTAIMGIAGGNAHTRRMLQRAGLIPNENNNNNNRRRPRNSNNSSSSGHNNENNNSNNSNNQNENSNNNNNNNNNNGNGNSNNNRRRNFNSILRRLTSMASGVNVLNLPSESDQLHQLFMNALGSSSEKDSQTAEIVLDSLPRMNPEEARKRHRALDIERSNKNNNVNNTNKDIINNKDDDDDGDQPSCPVCFDEYHVASEEEDACRNNNFDPDFGYSQQPPPAEKIVELPCNHIFHERCVLPWLKKHHSCPVCRASLATDEDLE